MHPTLLPLGTPVRSRMDYKIVGTIQGYGTLMPLANSESNDGPVIVYLVWQAGSPGSNSLCRTIHVLEITRADEVSEEHLRNAVELTNSLGRI